jgi:DNA polymerase-3 subunit epsilon/ATP-dependent DNA helicase DinG
MPTLVALDLETTGLNPHKDAIIEIGAIRFNERRVEDEFSVLVNPGRSIPSFIQNLTGISDEMVHAAPPLGEVLPKLEAFVGNAPIIGHNIRFDLGFLQRYGLFELNEIIDTYELAAVLLPSASRYKLGSIAQALNLPIRPKDAHRALADAEMTQGIFARLYEIAESLPLDLIAEIVRQSEPLDWDGAWVFRQILRARSRNGIQPKHARSVSGNLFEETPAERFPPLQAAPESLYPLDIEETASVLEPGGPFAAYFEAYEHRSEQVEMLRVIADALSEGRHWLIEAGTGVGKSFAYLIPAAKWALQNNTRVVVSTNTINLQDQLIRKDIPDLRAALGWEVRAAVLKGRANYLCPRRLEAFRRHGPRTKEEMRVLAKILVWQLENQSGDRAEITLTGPVEKEIWRRVSAEDDACTADMCVRHTGGSCPFYRARQAAQSAHLLIVNHALLLADSVSGSHVLPEYDYLIVDEAHHLESATTNALSFRLSRSDFDRALKELGGEKSGVLGRLLSSVRGILSPADFALFAQRVERASTTAFRLQNSGKDFFAAISDFADSEREGYSGPYAWQARISHSKRKLPMWEAIEAAWEGVSATFEILLNLLRELHQGASELYEGGHESLEDGMSDIGNAYRHLNEIREHLNNFIVSPSSDTVYWIEVRPNDGKLTLQTAPLHVGALVQKYLWHEKRSVILTSATLTAHGSFDYIRNTLGAEDTETLALGSPFDYETSTLLYLPSDIPEPNQRGYHQAIEHALLNLCRATGGRTLALFTSYTQLRRVSRAISGALAREGIQVYEQGEGASPNALLETFREAEQAVLLGTRSFWEGVDIPGEALSVVAIAKLPFDVPSDPLISARSELYEDSFSEYYLPEAILKFRQGFGRLIRAQSDRGIVVIFDKRVQSKRYGRLFIESLPRCTVRVAPLNELPHAAAQWLG